MSIYIHNHIVCPAKYRRGVFLEEADITLKDICLDISKRYEIHFVEIGTDKDHFLVQSIPTYILAGIAPVYHMIIGAWILDAYRSGHAASPDKKRKPISKINGRPRPYQYLIFKM